MNRVDVLDLSFYWYKLTVFKVTYWLFIHSIGAFPLKRDVMFLSR